MIRTVHFHGKMAKEFNCTEVKLAGDTLYMVVRGLVHRFGPKIKNYIQNQDWHVVRENKNDKLEMSNDEVHLKLGSTTDIHFTPALEMSSDVVRIVVGVVLIAVGSLVPSAQWLIPAGVALVAGGVAGLLTPKPSGKNDAKQADINASYYYDSIENITTPGNCVPLLFGRKRRCSTIVTSIGVTAETF